jgi:ATP-dependent DNA helicase RecG
VIYGSETETVEFKRSTSELEDSLKDISAILNKHGHGELYFGIRNNGEVIGQEISDKTLRDISWSIGNHIEPKIYPEIDTVTIDFKTCARVIFEGSEAPYLARGKAYIRVFDESLLMKSSELESFILKRNDFPKNWDSLPSNITLEDIDEGKLKVYMQRANESGRIEWAYSNKADVLKKLKLLVDGIPCNAAKVMFASDCNLELQMAHFATNEKLTFTDIRHEEGTINELVNAGERYIIDSMNWRVELNGNLQRAEIPEVPLAAVREALFNSYCHRLYRGDQNNEVAIFKNRIEIYNPGTFPEGLTPQDYIEQEEPSIQRNPLLARILYYSKDIEHFGTGLKRIDDECREAGVRYEFKQMKRGFRVIFYRRPSHDGEVLDTNSGKIAVSADKPPITADKPPIEKRAEAILEFISTNGKITNSDARELLGVGETVTKDLLRKMVEANQIEAIGNKKSRIYVLPK